MDEIIYSSAKSIAKAIQDKEISAEEAVQAHLDRIDEVNPKLNAVVQIVRDRALAEAREADAALARGESKGPLHGVPMTIKDNLDTEGIISTGGTKGRESFVPKHDATAVARVREAGAIILGKTNTPELTLSFVTDNLVYGATNNPYDLGCISGGSSGGAAAIIAAGGSPLDIGSDTGGSIRLPSHFCGIAGIRPTTGRVPRTGHIIPPGGAADALTQLGPMARYVEDLALTLPILAGPDWRDPAIVPMPLGDPNDVDINSLRIAVHTDNGIKAPTPETANTVTNVAKALSDSGVRVEEARPRGIEESLELAGKIFQVGFYQAGGNAGVQHLFELYGTNENTLLDDDETSEPITASELGYLLSRWDAFRSTMLSFMEDYDAILCPVNASPALPHGGMNEETYPGFSYTMTYNLTGWPGAVVRAGTSPEGLPIGVQIVARPWREDVALALAQHIETALGGWQRPQI